MFGYFWDKFEKLTRGSDFGGQFTLVHTHLSCVQTHLEIGTTHLTQIVTHSYHSGCAISNSELQTCLQAPSVPDCISSSRWLRLASTPTKTLRKAAIEGQEIP